MTKQIIIQMDNHYPFGQLSQNNHTNEVKAYVKKTLHYQTNDQYDIIKHMIHLLKAAKHDNLINFEKILQSSNQMHIYYEYVPLRLEKWLVMVDQELIQSLQSQMIELAEYLTRSSIKFSFRPECIGLNNQMEIKYFLDQFSIDMQNQEERIKEFSQEIKAHFKQLGSGQSSTKNFYEKQQKQEKEEKQGKKFIESISTNESISPLDPVLTFADLEKYKAQSNNKNLLKMNLAQKLENSKKKSLEVLSKLKRKSQI